MVHQEVPEGGSEGAEALEGKEVRWRVVFGDVGVDAYLAAGRSCFLVTIGPKE